MKYFLSLILLTIFIANAIGWVARGNYYNPANPGKCTFNDQLIITPGDKVDHPDMCAAINCEDDKGNVVITGCGAYVAPENCTLGAVIDEKASYPKCCPREIICNGVKTT